MRGNYQKMIPLENITTEKINEQGMQMHEPKWLRDERMQAWKQYQNADEIHWKKTKTPKIDLNESLRLIFPSEEIIPLKVEKKVPEGSSGKITFHDDKVLRISLKKELANKGVIFCDMQTAVLERADLLEQHLRGRNPSSEKLSAMQQALWSNGYFLWVPAGVVIEEPFQVQFIHTSPEKSMMLKNVIVAETSSQVMLEELSESSVEGSVLHANTTEIIALESAVVKYFPVQHWGDDIYDLSERSYWAERNAKITSLLSVYGAASGRLTISGHPLAESSHVQHDAIIIGKREQRFKIIPSMHHIQQHSEGLMRYKGILKDSAYSDLDGVIRVTSQGQFTHSRLEEQTLLLSEKARCDALPALDIQTENVQVSHAASVAQADPERMFYLMSRGLNEEEARALLVEGFFEDLITLIPREEWQEFNRNLIEAQLLTHKDE